MTCIALIGLMGSGKSTVGRLLADHLGLEFVDVDRAIEDRTGSTVRELWEAGGEAAYRRLESDECLAATTRGDVVLATPGGAVLDERVRSALQRCRVVWMRADPAVIADRVSMGDHRPLLGDDPRTVLGAMANERAAVYGSLAGLVVESDRLGPEQCAAVIMDWLAEPKTTAIRRQ